MSEPAPAGGSSAEEENKTLRAQVAKLLQEQTALNAKVEKTMMKVIVERRALVKRSTALETQNAKLLLLFQQRQVKRNSLAATSNRASNGASNGASNTSHDQQDGVDEDEDEDEDGTKDVSAPVLHIDPPSGPSGPSGPSEPSGTSEGAAGVDKRPVSAAAALMAQRGKTESRSRSTSAGSLVRRARVAELEKEGHTREELVGMVSEATAIKTGVMERVKDVLDGTIDEVKDLSVLIRALTRFAKDPAMVQDIRAKLFGLMWDTVDAHCSLSDSLGLAENTDHACDVHGILESTVNRLSEQLEVSNTRRDQLNEQLEARAVEASALAALTAKMTAARDVLDASYQQHKAAVPPARAWVQQREQLVDLVSILAGEVEVLEARILDHEGPPAPTAAQLAETTALAAVLERHTARIAEQRTLIASVRTESDALAQEETELRRGLETLIATKTRTSMSLRRLADTVSDAAARNHMLRTAVLDAQNTHTRARLRLRELATTYRGLQRVDTLNADLAWAFQEIEDENSKMIERWAQLDRIAEFEVLTTDCIVHAKMVAIFGEEVAGPPPPTRHVRILDVPTAVSGSGGADAKRRSARMSTDGSRLRKSFSQRSRSSSEFTVGGSRSSVVDVESMLASDAEVAASSPTDTSVADRDDLLLQLRARTATRRVSAGLDDGTGTSLFDDDDIVFFDDKDGNEALSSPGGLDIDCEIRVRAGTLRKLVELLTYERSPMPSYVRAFLLTYRAFTGPLELLDLLIERYCITPPPELSGDALLTFTKSKQVPIRLRVFNILRKWIKDHYYDFEAEPELTERFLEFVRDVMPVTAMERPAKILERLLTRPLSTSDPSLDASLASTRASISRSLAEQVPASIDLTVGTMSIMDTDVKSIALALSIHEQNLFSAIRPQEFLGLAWSKKDTAPLRAANVLAMINWFNAVSRWVVHQILSVDTKIADRVKVLKRCIRLAGELIELNNVNGAMEVLSGVNSTPVFRLKKHWAALDRKTRDLYSHLKTLLSRDSSYKQIRAYVRGANPPCIPYLGLSLTDLTFIEEGNPDYIQIGSKSFINFAKCWLVAGIIQQVRQYQQTKYAPTGDEAVAGFACLHQLMVGKYPLYEGEDEPYDRSLIVEPRI